MQAALILSFFAVIISNEYINADTSPNQPDPKCTSVCSTPACTENAEYFTKSMDFNADPCNDFYQYVCGNYLKNEHIPNDQISISRISTIENQIRNQLIKELNIPVQSSDLKAFKKMKTHFQNCLDESAIDKVANATLLELLEKLGGWPVLLGDKWKEENYNWQDTVSAISNNRIEPVFPIQLGIDSDPTNTSNYIFKVNPADTMINKNVNDFNFNSSVDAYKNLPIEIAVLLGATREKATAELQDSYNFEIQLMQLRLSSQDVNRTSVKKLSNQYKNMPWLEVINNMLRHSNVSITEDEIVLVENQVYVSKVGDLIANTPKRVLANYQIWSVIYRVLEYLSKPFRDVHVKQKISFEGVKEDARNKTCFRLLRSTFSHAIGAMYMKINDLDKKSKDAADKILQNLKEELQSTMNKTSWMDEETRKNAQVKLQKIKRDIGSPKELLDDQKTDKFYESLEIDAGNFLEDYMRVDSHHRNMIHNLVGKSIDKTGWIFETNVIAADPNYNPTANKINIPAAILQEPYFKLDRPDYLNYGAIGFAMGHEIIHGFDWNGKEIDENGNQENWWTFRSEIGFKIKVGCLVDKYNNYNIKQVNQTINGGQTFNGDVADAGGIKLAYQAYQKLLEGKQNVEECLPNFNYSPQKMFWISAGSIWCGKNTDDNMRSLLQVDDHSPLEARVNVAFSNIQKFADDFSCPIGSKMNPTKKCSVW